MQSWALVANVARRRLWLAVAVPVAVAGCHSLSSHPVLYCSKMLVLLSVPPAMGVHLSFTQEPFVIHPGARHLYLCTVLAIVAVARPSPGQYCTVL